MLSPRADFKSFHLTNPDGWDLQISNRTKDSRGGAEPETVIDSILAGVKDRDHA